MQPYLCDSWQGLLQQLVYLVGRGYIYWHVTYFPMNKQKKWEQIDEKLIKKYGTDKSKWQRSRLKVKGMANFMYLRWKQIAVILHTNGDLPEDFSLNDPFSDIRYRHLTLKISELTSFDIQYIQKSGYQDYTVTVRFSKEMYRGLKDELYEVSKIKDPNLMKKTFEKINGFPAWAGIVSQRRFLAKYLVKQARKNDVKLNESELKIKDRRVPVKVWI